MQSTLAHMYTIVHIGQATQATLGTVFVKLVYMETEPHTSDCTA